MKQNAAILESQEPERLEPASTDTSLKLVRPEEPEKEENAVKELAPVDLLLAATLRDGRFIHELSTRPEEIALEFGVEISQDDVAYLKAHDLDSLLTEHYDRCFADGPFSSRDPSASFVGIDVAAVVVGAVVGTVVGILVSEVVVTYKTDEYKDGTQGDASDPYADWYKDESEHHAQKL
jgi:hypothetical protein|tara:strand:+ start:168 stop:704 length:537 start_codon:yes stop_codon:yes gene_type:complete